MKTIKLFSLLIAVLMIFSSCGKDSENRVVDVIQKAAIVNINGTEQNTVEAFLGAFEGKQGDYIEFRFAEPQTFNTVFITEKTATVRQFNIYAEIDGKYTLIHTGKHILQDNIVFEEVTASAFKFEVVNTQIGNDHFIIQGISAYNITEGV